MPWTSLVTEINPELCVGNSLSTINANFESIDNYLENLSANLDTSDYFLNANNLSDLINVSTAQTNLGLSADTMSFKDEKTVAQAWVIFNGTSVTNVAGEDICQIIDSQNVSKVVRQTISANNYRYEIVYDTPLKYVGPIITDGAHYNRTEIITMSIDNSITPSVNKCRVYPSRIVVLSGTAFVTGTPGRYITVVVF